MTATARPQPGHPESTATEGSAGFRVVGQAIPRRDGMAKVTGQAHYTGDVWMPNTAHAKVLRSPIGHGRIVSLDARRALARPGVITVVSGDDLAGLACPRYGHILRDHVVLARDRVRFVGEPVAVVVAEDERTAQEALEEVQVAYEELRPVLTVAEALAPGAPLVHEDAYEIRATLRDGEVSGNRRQTNVCQESHVRWGDIEAAFARAEVVVEGEYYYPMTFAYPMEPYVCLAAFDAEAGLTIYSTAQHPFVVRRDIADVFGLPLNAVRLVTMHIGGGFGAKSFTKIEPLAALCARKAGRPVRVQLTVEESVLTTRADDALVRLRTAADRDGRLLARQAVVYLNSGAYAEGSPVVCGKSAVRLVGPYQYEAIDIASYAVYTHTCPASSYRGFAASQVTLAAEVQMDELAERLGQDPLEFRLLNAAEQGQRFFPGKRGLTADLPGDLRKLAEALDWGAPLPRNRGRGLAAVVLDAGAQPVGRSEVRVLADGSVTVRSGSTEMGQGSRTVLAQIAAEEFGTALDSVRVVQSDTEMTPYSYSTGAERTTTLEGRALLAACADAKEQLRQLAAETFETAADDIHLDQSGIVLEGRHVGWGDIIQRAFGRPDMEVVGRAHLRQAGDLAELPPFWALSLAGVEVEVDPETGRVIVRRLASVADVGLAINPTLVEAQELGSAVQGLGVALGEELVYDGQQLVNGSLLEYRVPRFSDVPEDVRSVMVEHRDGVGPYGAKGMGEGPTSSMCAAIANAIYQAVGVRLHRAPFTPERVWQAMRVQATGVEGRSAGGPDQPLTGEEVRA